MAQLEVLPADQEKINKFGNLNTQVTSHKMELDALIKKRQSYEDAELEIMEADAEEAPYQIGNTFMVLPVDTVNEELGKDNEAVSEKISQLEAIIAEKESEMSTLRTVLYAKFGRDNINLGD